MDTLAPTEANLKAIVNQLINVDVLLELVKDRPVIWDKTAEGYRNKDVSIPAWEDIYKIIFDCYDNFPGEQKKFVGKLIKQKWTTARDIWQRSHKKRKEAMQRGENVNDLKDNARYEKLQFLAKIYDKDDYCQPDRDDKILEPNVGNIERPLSPPVDLDGETAPIFNCADFQRNFFRVLMHQRPPPKPDQSTLSRKGKLETNSSIRNAQVKNDQGTSSQKPLVINVEDRFKVSSPMNTNKRKMSSIGHREADKSALNQIKSPKREKVNSTTPLEEMSLSARFQAMKNNPNQNPKKLGSIPDSQLVKQRKISRPSTSNDLNLMPRDIEKNNGSKHEINEIEIKQEFNEGENSYPHMSQGENSHPRISQGENSHPRISQGENSHPRISQGENSHPRISHGENSHPRISQGKNSHPRISQGKKSHPRVSQGENSHPRENSNRCMSQGDNSSNADIDQFVQLLRSKIDDFNKSQIIEFCFEMLKPHIKDFNASKLLDFQIEALQLVKKIGGNQAT